MKVLPAQVLPSFPEVVSVEVTSICNLKCRMCIHSTGGTVESSEAGHMTSSTWEKVLELTPNIGKVCFSGFGENFTNPIFIEMLHDLEAQRIPFGMSTNGTLITPAIVDALSELKFLHHVNVSIDSPDPKRYREIRGVELGNVLDGLERLANGLGTKSTLTVSSIVMADNIDSLALFPAILERAGVTDYVLQGLLDDNSRPGKRPELDSDTARRVYDIHRDCLSRDIKVYYLGIYFPDHLKSNMADMPHTVWAEVPADLSRAQEEVKGAVRETRKCLAPWEHINISSEGDVVPCCFRLRRKLNAPNERGVMGNLNNQRFAEIWRSENFAEFRQKLLEGPPPPVCADCTVTSAGPHFFNLYNARIDFHASSEVDNSIHLVVQNTGLATWTRGSHIDVGTSKEHDRHSSLHHRSWISQNRVSTIEEASVKPGEKANIYMVFTTRRGCKRPEVFQLVADDICWLRDTQFEVQVERNRWGRPRAKLHPWPRV